MLPRDTAVHADTTPAAARWRRLALRVLLLASAAVPPLHAAIDPDDLLPVDAAFSLQASAPARDMAAVAWTIADGYYLYRHRIAVVPLDASASGALRLPAGKPHTDEFFGDVETYRGRVTGTLDGIAPRGDSVRLQVKYQGCADAGICYPPQVREVTVRLPGGTTAGAGDAAADAGGDAGFAALGRSLLRRAGIGGAGEPAAVAPVAGARAAGAGALVPSGTPAAGRPLPLPAEQAFGFEAIADGGDALLLRFTPAPGYYLYRDRTTLALAGDGLTAGTPRWPSGTAHRDAYFGEGVVYFRQVDVPLPLRRRVARPVDATLQVTFQGCQTDGICYPPMTRRVAVSLPAGMVTATSGADDGATGAVAATPGAANAGATDTASATAGGGTGADGTPAAAVASAPALPGAGASRRGTGPGDPAADGDGIEGVPELRTTNPGLSAAAGGGRDAGIDGGSPQGADGLLAAALSGPDRWLALLGFFGAGLLLAFTPCVLPMIPILSGLIAGAGTRIGTRRALLLSFVYVLANALVFTVAGVVAALLGANLQIAFQNPWIIATFAALFVALALSSFGAFTLQLPKALRARLGALTERQRGGSLGGVATMGALSALIVGPCVAPPLAGAVLYIGQQQDPVFGGLALFLLAMGMGAPLLAFGVAAGHGMPASGPWMLAVQRVFGFVFLGLAVWMLSRILPGPVVLALTALLVLAAAAWSWSLQPGLRHAGARWATRVATLVLVVVGVAQLVGALAGGRDPLQPLAALRAGGQPASAALPFRGIKSLADLEREVALAAAAGRPLLFDFYADWCVACKQMERDTFPRPEVHAALAGFVLLKADVTANDATDQALMRALGIVGPPATLYYVDGRERRDLRLYGFEPAGPFSARAARAVPSVGAP